MVRSARSAVVEMLMLDFKGHYISFIMYMCLFPIGFNPVHLVVRQSDSVDALPTDEHSDVEYPFENFLEETPDANPPSDSMFPSERSTRSLDDMPIDETDPDSWIAKEGDASSNDIGIQCDIVDLLATLAEYQKNTNEDDLPWFVSAMNMSRDDTGMPVTEDCTVFT